MSSAVLKRALALVKTHGFSREALSLAASVPVASPPPLSDAAVTALFGAGDAARRTLIRAWLADARARMAAAHPRTVRDALSARLDCNRDVLAFLPGAFALLASPRSGVPPLDPRPAFEHAVEVADAALNLTASTAIGYAWYAQRLSLGAIYTAAELHQLASPATAQAFLDSLLASHTAMQSTLHGAGVFSDYVVRSWAGIIRSSGIL